MMDSIFRPLNKLLTARHLQSPLGADLKASISIDEALRLQWFRDFDGEYDPPPWAYEDICLVKRWNKPVGYVCFGPFAGNEFDEFEKVADVMEPILPDMKIASNATALELVKVFASTRHNWFFVLHGAKITGTVSRLDLFYNPSFRLVLLALIFELEQRALELAISKGTESWKALSEDRRQKARSVLEIRKGKISPDSEHEPLRQLLGCTTFADKATILAKLKCIPDLPPRKIRSAFGKVEEIRNRLVHTNPEEIDPLLPYQGKLFPLIDDVHKLIDAIIKVTPSPPSNIFL